MFLALCVCVITVASADQPGASGDDGKKPNILYIMYEARVKAGDTDTEFPDVQKLFETVTPAAMK